MNAIASDLEVCIMHCNESIVADCRQAIANQTLQPQRVFEVVNISPLNRAYNAYFKRMELAYCVKVDADTILFPEALQKLRQAFINLDASKYYCMLGFVDDILAGRQSGVKISRVSPELKSIRLPDQIACDRREARIMRDEHGLAVANMEGEILGMHLSNWNGIESIVSTFFNTGQKCLMLGDQKMKLFYRLCRKFVDTGSVEPLIAIVAFSHGMFIPRDEEKNNIYGHKVIKHLRKLTSNKHHVLYPLTVEKIEDETKTR